MMNDLDRDPLNAEQARFAADFPGYRDVVFMVSVLLPGAAGALGACAERLAAAIKPRRDRRLT